MNLSAIIYLDTDFIVEAYEAAKNRPAAVRITRSENLSAGLSAPLLKAGASTTQTKEFPISARSMVEDIRKKLDSFPSINLATSTPAELPDYFWTEGEMCVGTSQVTRKSEVISEDEYFRLHAGDEGARNSLCLLTNDVYFSTGYDQILKHVRGAARGFGIRVKALVKKLAISSFLSWPLAAPLIVEKTGES